MDFKSMGRHQLEMIAIIPDVVGIALTFSVIYINLILLQLETEFLIPLAVTAYGAEADRREGDLSMYAYRSLPFQYKMIRFVQA